MNAAVIPEHGVIFSAPMVRALRAGQKSETRRLLGAGTALVDGHTVTARRFSEFDLEAARLDAGPSPAGNAGPYLHAPRRGHDTVHRIDPRLTPGTRLWVREGFALHPSLHSFEQTRLAREAGNLDAVLYRADGAAPAGVTWRSPLLMPRWAARVLLDLQAVGLERLQAMRPDDARAEGIVLTRASRGEPVVRTDGAHPPVQYLPPGPPWNEDDVLRAEFASGWNGLHRRTGRWEDNPWVIVLKLQVRS